jgi:MFS family permease
MKHKLLNLAAYPAGLLMIGAPTIGIVWVTFVWQWRWHFLVGIILAACWIWWMGWMDARPLRPKQRAHLEAALAQALEHVRKKEEQQHPDPPPRPDGKH